MFPEIKISETLILPTYILTLSLLYCFLLFFLARRALRKKMPVTTALNIAFILMVSGFIGGRFLHVVYEAPSLYASDWPRAFKFWEGGFVFYGGFLFAFLASLFYVKRKKLRFWEWADFFAPILAMGYGLGRISCFLAGCCYGRSCDFPWSVTFPWDLQKIPRHPVQLYSVFWELGVFALLLWLEKKRVLIGRPGALFLVWLLGHSSGRLMMEFFRDDFRGAFLLGLSLSTWISLAIFLGASVVWRWLRQKNS